MSKMKQIAALTAMLVGVVLYASPAKSAVCFLPDDDGSCGGGDIEISDNNSNQDQCTDFKLSKNQRDSKEYSSDCYTCESCTYNNRTTYKCSPKSGATWYGNLGVCCTNGETYDSAEGQCCPAGGCTHDCDAPKKWSTTLRRCECPNGKETSTGTCCADEEHVDGAICCPEKKHNEGGKCVCDSQYNTDKDGNCILPTACTYSTETACNSSIWGTSCQKDSNGCWWPSKCNKAGGYAELPARDCGGPMASGDIAGNLGENGAGAACYKAICASGWKNGVITGNYDSSIFNVVNLETQCAATCHQVFCKSSCKTGITSYAAFNGTTCPASCDPEKCEIKTSCTVELDEQDNGSAGNVMNISGIPGYVKLKCDKAEVLANYSLTNDDVSKLVSKVSTTCNIKYNCIVRGNSNYINLPVTLTYSASSNIDKSIPLSGFTAMRNECKNMGGTTLVRVSKSVDCGEASFNESGCSLNINGIGKDCSGYEHAWHTTASTLGIITSTPYNDCTKAANVASCTKCVDGNSDEFAEISSCKTGYQPTENNTKCEKIPSYLEYTCVQGTGTSCSHFLQGSSVTCVNCEGIGGSGPEVANNISKYVHLLCLYDENKGYFTTSTNTTSGGSYIGHLRRCAMVRVDSKVPDDFCTNMTKDLPSCTIRMDL